MMFSAASDPFQPWRSAIVPILAFMVLTSLATRLGRERKQRLGTAESRHGRGAAQVAANLGVAALAMSPSKTALLVYWALGALMANAPPTMILAPALAALAEAAADTVSSEIGQVLGGHAHRFLPPSAASIPAPTAPSVSPARSPEFWPPPPSQPQARGVSTAMHACSW